MSEQNGFLSKIFPAKGDSGKTVALKIIVLVSALVFIAAAIIIACTLVDANRTKNTNDKLAGEHTSVVTSVITTTAPPETEATEVTTEPPPLITLSSMESILEENPDTAGWVTIDGTKIDNVVVQCGDNDYYLDHDFYGKSSKGGTVFADYRNKLNTYNDKQSDNIVIYGHNQADGTQFGTLKKYKIKPSSGAVSNFEFYKEHPTFYFSNLYEEYTYKIIATFIVEVEEKHSRDGVIFDYHNYLRFSSKRPYQQFIDNVMLRSAIDTGVDFDENDKFLTLSTCSNEFEPSRLVVIGRRLRDGESPEVDTSKAAINYDCKEPDYDYIYNH